MKRIPFCILSCLIAVGAYFFWAIPYRGILNYHEQFQLFLTDSDYFLSHLSQPGGLSVYCSEFLVQFYNNYWMGAAILAIELVLIQWLSFSFLSRLRVQWLELHPFCLYALSLCPLMMVWLALGDINVMHSLVVAVILALSLMNLSLCFVRHKFSFVCSSIVSLFFFLWAGGTTHCRIQSSSISDISPFNSKTCELLDYDLLVRTNRWEDILRKAQKQQPDLPLSVCATNLALGMTNQLGSRAMQFYQHGVEGLFPSFVNNQFSNLTTAEVYFQLGLINTAQRYCFESMEASPNYAKSCRCVRRLAETNLINGQYAVARKYLHILEKTIFYKKWAQRTLALIAQGEPAIASHPLYGRLRRMRLHDDFLFSDSELDKICGRLLLQNYDNVLAMQYMLIYPLLQNDYEKFVQYMHLVKEEVPNSREFASFQKYLRSR